MTEAAVSLTFKAHTGFDAPWIVIYGSTVEEAGNRLAQVRQLGIFGAVRSAAAEFAAAPVTSQVQAVANVQAAGMLPQQQPTYPGPNEVAPWTPQPTAQVTQQYQQNYQPPAQQQGQAPNNNPVCPDCGGPTSYKEGSGRTGPYKGYFCNNKPQGAKGHVQWL